MKFSVKMNLHNSPSLKCIYTFLYSWLKGSAWMKLEGLQARYADLPAKEYPEVRFDPFSIGEKSLKKTPYNFGMAIQHGQNSFNAWRGTWRVQTVHGSPG